MDNGFFGSKQKLTNNIFLMEMICIFIAMLGSTWDIPMLVSTVFAVNFMLVALLLLLTFNKHVNRGALIIYMIFVLMTYISVAANGYLMSFSYMKNWIMVVTTISYLYWVLISNITETMVKAFFACGIALACMYVFAYFSGVGIMEEGYFAGAYTFNTTNPNAVGGFFFTAFLCVYIARDYVKNGGNRIFYMFLCVFLIYLIYLTKARSCWISIAFFFCCKLFAGKKYRPSITFLVLLSQIVIPFLYLAVVKTDIMEVFGFLSSEGKSLSSRVEVWEYALKTIGENPIFGVYYSEIHGFGIAHNDALDTLLAYGIPTYIVQFMFFQKVINEIGKKAKHKYQLTGIYAFLAMIVHGGFEEYMFGGLRGISILFCSFLILAKFDKDKNGDNIGLIIAD